MNTSAPPYWRVFCGRLVAIAILGITLAACGGGGGDEVRAIEGTREARTLASTRTGTAYPLSIYLPPESAGPRSQLPIIYMLDGEGWFETLVGIAESTRRGVIIVGIHTAGQRNRDFVPKNACTGNGGGQAAYFNFIRQELIPYVEGSIGGDPQQRALFGHSHGGSFVLYALFSEAPGAHSFKAYLASDASIGCIASAATGWEQSYASAYRALPVRLHLSYASQGNGSVNASYGNVLKQRNYEGLTLAVQGYAGTHGGIVPQVLDDVMGFAFDAAP